MHSTWLLSHLDATGNTNILCTTDLNFLTWWTNSQARKLDNIVYFWCKTVQFLAVSYGWAKTVFTQKKTKVKGILVYPVINRQEGSYRKCHSWTHFHRSREPKCVWWGSTCSKKDVMRTLSISQIHVILLENTL